MSTPSTDPNAAAVEAAAKVDPNAKPATHALGPASGLSFTLMLGPTIATVVFVVVELALAYYYFGRTSDTPLGTRAMWFGIMSVVAALVIYGTYFIVQGSWTAPTWSGTVTPSEGVTTNRSMVIPGSSIPVSVGTNGGNYGVQWWMFIQDWNYRFGQEKTILTRGASGALNPYVFLDSIENTLDVKINLMSSGSGSGSSEPAGVGYTGGSTDDSYTCKVKNVPLQSWFAVSMSVSNRNVDIYLNGMLVRSCLLPGVPKAPSGDAGVMTNGGFSGNLAALNFYAGALNPSMAMAFYQSGPPAAAVAQTTSTSTTPAKPYVVKLAVIDPTGQELNKYTY
jgi:hypothetical protein